MTGKRRTTAPSVAAAPDGRPMRVTVAYAGPGAEAIVTVELPAGATLRDAVERSQVVTRLRLAEAALSFAIFGQRAAADTPLRDGDRVELLQPLIADAKEVRRRNAAERPLAPQRSRAKHRR